MSMKEDIVNIKTAMLAKDAGFNADCQCVYIKSKLRNEWHPEDYPFNYIYDMYAPSQALLQKWLRVNHNIDIDVRSYKKNFDEVEYTFLINGRCVDGYSVYNRTRGVIYNSYEDALNVALEDSLEEVIRRMK